MFLYRVRLFSLFGFKVYVDASWLLLAALIIWSLASGVFPHLAPGRSTSTYLLMGAAAALGLLASIVLHETAHSLVARRYDMPIRGITLFLFGGVAEMQGEPTSARAEFLMALAGPATSAALGLLFSLAAGVASAAGGPGPSPAVLTYLAGLNWTLALFNLAPAFPLDGGRMLRAALWGLRKDYGAATRTAAAAGRLFGLILILLGVFEFIRGDALNGVWLFVIGFFVRGAAGLATRQLSTRRALAGEAVSRFMTASPISVTPQTSIQSLVDDFIYRHHHKSFPVTQDGRLVGCIGTTEIAGLARDEWPRLTVAERMRPCPEGQTIAPQADALQAMEKMGAAGAPRLYVVAEGRLVGVLTSKDLLGLLAVKLELERGEGRAPEPRGPWNEARGASTSVPVGPGA
ncbi:MAG TPA: site-2 protease family protein [Caulobacteraceae bacterium]|nr:site-2 protease family protein [Caulobacteraceae bacterium]